MSTEPEYRVRAQTVYSVTSYESQGENRGSNQIAHHLGLDQANDIAKALGVASGGSYAEMKADRRELAACDLPESYEAIYARLKELPVGAQISFSRLVKPVECLLVEHLTPYPLTPAPINATTIAEIVRRELAAQQKPANVNVTLEAAGPRPINPGAHRRIQDDGLEALAIRLAWSDTPAAAIMRAFPDTYDMMRGASNDTLVVSRVEFLKQGRGSDPLINAVDEAYARLRASGETQGKATSKMAIAAGVAESMEQSKSMQERIAFLKGLPAEPGDELKRNQKANAIIDRLGERIGIDFTPANVLEAVEDLRALNMTDEEIADSARVLALKTGDRKEELQAILIGGVNSEGRVADVNTAADLILNTLAIRSQDFEIEDVCARLRRLEPTRAQRQAWVEEIIERTTWDRARAYRFLIGVAVEKDATDSALAILNTLTQESTGKEIQVTIAKLRQIGDGPDGYLPRDLQVSWAQEIATRTSWSVAKALGPLMERSPQRKGPADPGTIRKT